MTEEQLARYRERLESGFYQTEAVRKKIAQRITDDIFPRKRSEK